MSDWQSITHSHPTKDKLRFGKHWMHQRHRLMRNRYTCLVFQSPPFQTWIHPYPRIFLDCESHSDAQDNFLPCETRRTISILRMTPRHTTRFTKKFENCHYSGTIKAKALVIIEQKAATNLYNLIQTSFTAGATRFSDEGRVCDEKHPLLKSFGNLFIWRLW